MFLTIDRRRRRCKNPIDLTEDQNGPLREIKRTGGALWRAYQLKETLRAVFAGGLESTDTSVMVDRWCSKAQRSRIPEFVKTRARSGNTATVSTPLSTVDYRTAATKD